MKKLLFGLSILCANLPATAQNPAPNDENVYTQDNVELIAVFAKVHALYNMAAREYSEIEELLSDAIHRYLNLYQKLDAHTQSRDATIKAQAATLQKEADEIDGSIVSMLEKVAKVDALMTTFNALVKQGADLAPLVKILTDSVGILTEVKRDIEIVFQRTAKLDDEIDSLIK